MKLKVIRTTVNDKCSLGSLYIDSHYFCDTLMDTTYLPEGRYRVVLNLSNRFKRIMPQIVNVPGFEGVRIIYMNTIENTFGCIVVGKHLECNKINNSRKTFDLLFKQMVAAEDDIEIEITSYFG